MLGLEHTVVLSRQQTNARTSDAVHLSIEGFCGPTSLFFASHLVGRGLFRPEDGSALG